MRRDGIERELQHAEATRLASELDHLRQRARIVARMYATSADRERLTLLIAARIRDVRARLRAALGEHQGSEARGHSLTRCEVRNGTRATWVGQR